MTLKKMLLLVLSLGITHILFAQEGNVKGQIKDENGEPIPFVNVLEEGTTNGVTSDFDGKYSIQVKDLKVRR